MSDDFRIRIQLPEQRHADSFVERLGLDLGSDEAKRLAQELEGRRLAVSQDENEIFLYASTAAEADQARRIAEAEVAEEGIEATISPVERWLDDEDRWTGEAPEGTWEEEELERGFAPWEVRVEYASHAEARDQADALEREGYKVVRRFRYLIVGTASEEEARALAERLHGEVEPGGELVWEVVPQNPFAIFGGLGGSGTPL